MKKSVILLFFVLLIMSTTVHAAEDSIYNYLKKVDNNYLVVVGANGKSGDSFAATDIVLALKKTFNVDVEIAVENSISPQVNKILIGHPCENKLIKLSCDQWPYDKGQALIKIMDNDLVIAGSTVDDTRMAAKVIANIKSFPELKHEKEVLVIGTTLNIKDIQVRNVTKESQFVCGDNTCEIGEKFLCPRDCNQTYCFTFCQRKGFANANCRELKSNPNVPSCLERESNEGPGYCAEGKVCCCELPPEPTPSIPTQQQQQPEVKKESHESVIVMFWHWLKELFSTIF